MKVLLCFYSSSKFSPYFVLLCFSSILLIKKNNKYMKENIRIYMCSNYKHEVAKNELMKCSIQTIISFRLYIMNKTPHLDLDLNLKFCLRANDFNSL